MMYPKPKSAPGRMAQSKLVKNRTNAMKEMEAWARKADDAGTSHASRMSGQLTDNVTEERMLRAKLWELSKERYKFLSQSAYEKKVFTDRMQRRSSSLLRRASSAALSTCSDAESKPNKKSSSAKQRWKNARLALLERLDPTKGKSYRAEPSRHAEDGVDSASTTKREDKQDRREPRRKGSASGSREQLTPVNAPTPLRPPSGASVGKLTLAPLSLTPAPAVREEGSYGGKPPPSPFPSSHSRNVKFDRSLRAEMLGQKQSAAEARGLSPRRLPSPRLFPGSRPPSASVASSAPNSATSQRSKAWNSPSASQAVAFAFGGKQGVLSSRYGMRLESKTHDPRYASLEESLSPLQSRRRNNVDVTSIVKSFDSLHVPPRRRKEAKPKIELKALEYMEEQGFIF